MQKLRIGIFFGGQSREREVSFAGGRTVYDNLNKTLFNPVPIFVDSLGNFILLDWQYIYKGTIRDFYPPISSYKNTESKFQIYLESLGELSEEEQNQIISQVGRKIQPQEFADLMDFAFLALHGGYGEDGNIQGMLEWYHIPYSGSGIFPSALGIHKGIQRDLMANAGFPRPKSRLISKEDWQNHRDKNLLLEELIQEMALPLVIKAPQQGSSIGVSILKEKNVQQFVQAIEKSLFIQEISGKEWLPLSEEEKNQFIILFTDIREGLSFPVEIENTEAIFYHPDDFLHYLNENLKTENDTVRLLAENSEESVLVESFIEGKEFSCIVIRDESGKAIALPPTEIRKFQTVFDYRSKYLPGMSRKVTPIETTTENIQKIRTACEQLFSNFYFDVYARIDGFLTSEGEVFLNDPNTTSGMLPSSFFFHQSAEIGLNPSQFLTYIIRTSLAERIKSGKKNNILKKQLQKLDTQINALQQSETDKIKVGVIMGGYSTERHISMESGRNIYEKLASSDKYEPIPIFLTGNDDHYDMYQIPVSIMLKDNADDVRDKVLNWKEYEKSEGKKVIQGIVTEVQGLTQKYAGNPQWSPQQISFEDLKNLVDVVFIALHGRPGEDGALQKRLEDFEIPYNGSGVKSSQITINKFETNEILKSHDVSVANHRLIFQRDWERLQEQFIQEIESQFSYPVITKPADEGCSSAVKKIKSREELIAFAQMMFRPTAEFLEKECELLKVKPNDEFPQKNFFLLEELISPNGAEIFMEITGGLLTHVGENGQMELNYEVFLPSETLATGDILSLEEKFLAGEGQNITPVLFTKDKGLNEKVMQKVQMELEKVAKILDIQGYARIDAFVRVFKNGEVELVVIEINSLPGMTPATCIFHQSALNGYKPYQFIDAILNFAFQRKQLLTHEMK